MRPTPSGPPISRERMIELLDRMKSRQIVVVGDVMLDRYLVGDTDRLSPEAPVPVVTIRETRSALGGAANVAANVAAIGATCRLVGVVGDDPHGTDLRTELAAAQLDDRFLVTVSGRPTTTKSRVLARGQQVVRIDEEVEHPVAEDDEERMIARAIAVLADADAVILEDYNKGALTEPVIQAVIRTAKTRGLPIVVDPKFRNFFAFAGATVFKPNRRELEAALGATLELQGEHTLVEALTKLHVDNLLMTLGAEGMVLVGKDHRVTHIPSLAREVFDVSGAGDTVTAWVATGLAAGASLREAAHVANYAAGIEVSKSGVATVAPAEVLAGHEERHDALGKLRRGGVI
jgi:D-beta-D-heptose 7-phosphate kinase/D-beta-D-heptose 1-phosphate adenosyltransferase